MKWKNLNKYRSHIDDLKLKSPFEILGVNSDVTDEEIKTAYRKLIKIYHPDVSDSFLSSNNEEILKIINDAYDKIMEEKNGN